MRELWPHFVRTINVQIQLRERSQIGHIHPQRPSQILTRIRRSNTSNAQLLLPHPLLASGMCLVDTPGIGSVFEGNTADSKTFMPAVQRVRSDFGEFWRELEWIGLQRHLKVLGIFCRLKHRDGKPVYSADLPRFFAYAHRVSARYSALRPLSRLLEPLMGAVRIEAFH